LEVVSSKPIERRKIARVMIDSKNGNKSATKKNPWKTLTESESARTIMSRMITPPKAENFFFPTADTAIG